VIRCGPCRRLALTGFGCIEPPEQCDLRRRGKARFKEKRAGHAATLWATCRKRHAVPHASDAVGFKPRVAFCVHPDAAGMAPDLLLA
jgi:hypothetical protein